MAERATEGGDLSPSSSNAKMAGPAADGEPAPSRTARPSKAKPKPAPPWRRAEAGQYRSSDDRFTIGSEGPSRWFVTDEAEHDEFGLARTTGPFPTLDAAKAAADDQRGHAPEASPLAERVARAATSGGGDPRAPAGEGKRTAGTKDEKRPRARGRAAAAEPAPPPPAPPPPKSWLETLADQDREAARRARRLIGALEEAGVADADALVRRDVVGNQPVVAARLLAVEVVRAIEAATRPAALDRLAKSLPAADRATARPRLAATAAVEAVLAILGGAKAQRDLPGWRLVERDGPPGEEREISLGARELRDAANGAADG